MKFAFVSSLAGVLNLAGCATAPSIPAGMRSGQFVGFSCEGGKSIQARAAPDGSTVRIRYEGGYELDNMGGGVYEGAGWRLITQGATAIEPHHSGKPVLRGCKPV